MNREITRNSPDSVSTQRSTQIKGIEGTKVLERVRLPLQQCTKSRKIRENHGGFPRLPFLLQRTGIARDWELQRQDKARIHVHRSSDRRRAGSKDL